MKKKQRQWGIGLATLLILVVVVFWAVSSNKQPENQYQPFPTERIAEAEPEAQADTIEFVQNRLAGYEEQLQDPKTSTSTPDQIALLVAIAFDYKLLGQYQDMIDTITAAAELGADSQAVQKTYSEMLYTYGAYQRALDQAEVAIALDETRHLPWLWRAELEERLLRENKKEQASLVYERALLATNYDEDVLIAYAEFLERTEQYTEAIDIWEEVISRYPERVQTAENRIEIINTMSNQE